MLPRVIRLRKRAVIAVSAFVILAGVGIPAAVFTQSVASAASVPAPAQGVDVSNYSDVTSWANVHQAGYSFTGVEATEGNYFQNPDYAPDAQGATAAGLYVTPYVFANPYGSQETSPPNGTAAQQADYAVAWIQKATASGNLMLPLSLDMEPDPYVASEQNSNECYGLTASQMVTWIQDFLNEAHSDLQALSPSPVPVQPPIIYTSASWWDACTGNSTAFGSDPLWDADWGTSAPAIPSGWDNYTMWQYTNSATVPGITSATDADYLGPTSLTSAVGSAIGGVQIRTLTSMQGDGETFTSSTLPPGLSISSSGLITGTPTTAGSYTVTVTPSSGAVPSSLTFTWDIHGTITVAGSARSTNAGSPVLYQVSSSGPDQSAGFAPSYTASGLPPGLSMSSSGVISGWPYTPGTYNVTVNASDGLGGTGSTSFTWTVNAAADTGTSGYIKQNGGTAKCLSAPSSATGITANEVYLWTCGGESWQDWTVVQDGTIRVGGKCLQMAGTGSATSTALELETCSSGNSEQQWRAATDGQLVNPAADKCLSIQSSSAANGAKPVVHACASSADYHFLRPASPVTSGEPAKCLAVSGSAIEIVTCADSTSQHWVSESNGTFEVSSDGDCLKEGGTTAGSKAILGGCSSTTVDEWSLPSSGRIGVELKNDASGLCVSVPSSSTASGTQLVMEPCAATPTESWHVE